MYVGGGCVLGKVLAPAESWFFCSVFVFFLGACQVQV